MVGQLATETGWSIGYILDKVNVVTLQLMMADLPHWVSPRNPDAMQLPGIPQDGKRQRNISNNQSRGMSPMEFFSRYAIKD